MRHGTTWQLLLGVVEMKGHWPRALVTSFLVALRKPGCVKQKDKIETSQNYAKNYERMEFIEMFRATTMGIGRVP